MLPLFDSPAAIRDQAIAQVAQHAEEHLPNFVQDAQAFVLAYLAQHGPTSGETLTEQAKAAGHRPHDDRAYGSVYMGLSKRGLIVKVGTVARKRGRMTSGGNVWALGVEP